MNLTMLLRLKSAKEGKPLKVEDIEEMKTKKVETKSTQWLER